MRKVRWSLYLVSLCLGGIAHAQQPPAAPPKPADGHVIMDVVVTDKAGNPIAGLAQDDFKVLDNGHTTPIDGFRPYNIASDQQNLPQIIVLIDGVNASFTAVSVARAQIENFLRRDEGKLHALISIAYLTDDGIDETGQPSTDGNALAQMLHGQQSELRAIRRSAGFYGAVERMQLSLKALDVLASHEEQIPGRKMLIWISPGWPIFDSPNIYLSGRDQRGIFNSLVGLSSLLRQAQMSIYVVDPLGTWDAGSMRSFLWQDFLKPVAKPDQANPGNLALQVLATQSGGRALFGSNDVAGEIAQCARDADTWYRLSIDAQRGKEAPTWHGVEVKIDEPGTKVRTRDGYYAQP